MIPIVLFAYNRLSHVKSCIRALQRTTQVLHTPLIVFSDGPKSEADITSVQEVRAFLRDIKGFKTCELVERPENVGLAQNIIMGVSEVFRVYDKAIVLEDDIVVAPHFLEVMNELLTIYENQENIGSVSGYLYPIEFPIDCPDFFLLPRASSWGWGTWKSRWNIADWSVPDFGDFVNSRKDQHNFEQGGEDLTTMLFKWKLSKNDSWAIRWIYTHYKHQWKTIFPKHNMVENIGNDGSGTHSPNSSRYQNQILQFYGFDYPDNLEEFPALTDALRAFFKPSIFRSILNKLLLFQVKLKA